jgi:putative FmdB family regulatory protein
MPAYEYICNTCQTREVRIAGIDDHVARCVSCGKPMLREMDLEKLLASYARPATQAPPPSG